MVDKTAPEQLGLDDFDKVADELAANYFTGLMTSYLSCVFMNSEYVQPKQSKREEYERRVLRAHRWPGDEGIAGLRCAYSGDPATHLVHRSQIPMLTGEEVMNFFPAGRGALPVAGPYLAAIQALPMGGRRAEGRLLFAHSDDADLMIALAARYVADNRRLLNLAKTHKLPAKDGPDLSLEREHGARDQKTKGPKYPDAKGPTSLVTSDLVDISVSARAGKPDTQRSSVTVYVMSNSGQGPSLEIHHIPSQLVRFLRLAGRPPNDRSWKALIARSWRSPQEVSSDLEEMDEQSLDKPLPSRKPSRQKKQLASVRPGPGRSRNDLLADVFPIFDAGFTDVRAARNFLRRYILGEVAWRSALRSNAGQSRHLSDPSLVDWNMAGLFLREVIGMDEKRIDKIREFADGLATHIASTNDKRLFQDLVFSQRSWEVRNALTKAQRNEARERNVLLFGLQDYLDVFEAEDSTAGIDWGLIRDLISIRLVESLHGQRFFREETKDWLQAPES